MFFSFVYKNTKGFYVVQKQFTIYRWAPEGQRKLFHCKSHLLQEVFFCFYVCSITLVASMKRPSTIRFLMNVLTQSAISKGPSMFFLIVCLFHLVFPRTGIKYMVFHTDWEFVQPRPYKLSWIDAYWYKDLEI